MATHTNILAWKIPGTKESGRLQSMWLQRVGHNWARTHTKNWTKRRRKARSNEVPCLMKRRRQWHPTPVLLPGKSHGQRSLVGFSHEVTKSQTWLSDFTFSFHFHALEKEMATHSSVLAWRIPGMAEPGGLPSMGLHRVGHGWSDLAAAAWWKHLHGWAKVSNLQLFCFVFPYHIFRKYSSFSFYTFS